MCLEKIIKKKEEVLILLEISVQRHFFSSLYDGCNLKNLKHPAKITSFTFEKQP